MAVPIYDAMVDYQEEHGYPPKLTELAEMVGRQHVSGVIYHLRRLRSGGYVTYHRYKPRGYIAIGARYDL